MLPPVTSYAIMQEAGPRARHNAQRTFHGSIWGADPKRVGTVTIMDEGAKFALGEFVHTRYLESGVRSYGGHRFEWKARGRRTWKADDGKTPSGREWSVVLTLVNGRSTHDVRLLAWKNDQ